MKSHHSPHSLFLCSISPWLGIFFLRAESFKCVGAAMIATADSVICVRYLPYRMPVVTFSTIAAASSIRFATRPKIGGILTHYLSWHGTFRINILIGIFTIFFVMKTVPKGSPTCRYPGFDSIGAVALFGVMAANIYARYQMGSFIITDPQILFAFIYVGYVYPFLSWENWPPCCHFLISTSSKSSSLPMSHWCFSWWTWYPSGCSRFYLFTWPRRGHFPSHKAGFISLFQNWSPD